MKWWRNTAPSSLPPTLRRVSMVSSQLHTFTQIVLKCEKYRKTTFEWKWFLSRMLSSLEKSHIKYKWARQETLPITPAQPACPFPLIVICYHMIKEVPDNLWLLMTIFFLLLKCFICFLMEMDVDFTFEKSAVILFYDGSNRIACIGLNDINIIQHCGGRPGQYATNRL